DGGSVLPFQPTPSASIAVPTLKDSVHQRRVDERHLPANAPNILIVLMDDVGFGVADTFGCFVHTPTLSRLAAEHPIHHRNSSCIDRPIPGRCDAVH
ncbi:hypothetical protein ACC733_37255, partial [Rhizobium johnstonii]|uniref:hypothetical protein n=1 Tax=Rhizobium johnstonii TaxID=3019933 RepID=UPI003F9D0727